MKTYSKPLSLCLAFGLVLLFGSVASAGWGYVVTTPTPYVVQYATPTPYVYGATVYGYRAPVVTVPVLMPPVRVVRPAPVLVRPVIHPRIHRHRVRLW